MPSKKGLKKRHAIQTEPGQCHFCLSFEDNEDKFGKMITRGNITTHYFCMLFASGLSQNGSDDEGLFGFLPKDINQELRRGSKLACSFCLKKGATIGCIVHNCRIKFHFSCGLENDALFWFFDNFSSYCGDHRPQQKSAPRNRLSFKGTAKSSCAICMCAVNARVSNTTLRATCCNNGWFHRTCIQQYAKSSGLHFFRCPLCANCDKFKSEMLECGIYIPDKDAAWEMEEGAFQELLQRYDRCDVADCKCPQGRNSNILNTEYELMLCDVCGSSGTHLVCSKLKTPMDDWMCADCSMICTKKKSKGKSPAYKGSSKRKKIDVTALKAKMEAMKANGMTGGKPKKRKADLQSPPQAKRQKIEAAAAASCSFTSLSPTPPHTPSKQRLSLSLKENKRRKQASSVATSSDRRKSDIGPLTNISTKTHSSVRRKSDISSFVSHSLALPSGPPRPRSTKRSQQAGLFQPLDVSNTELKNLMPDQNNGPKFRGMFSKENADPNGSTSTNPSSAIDDIQVSHVPVPVYSAELHNDKLKLCGSSDPNAVLSSPPTSSAQQRRTTVRSLIASKFAENLNLTDLAHRSHENAKLLGADVWTGRNLGNKTNSPLRKIPKATSTTSNDELGIKIDSAFSLSPSNALAPTPCRSHGQYKRSFGLDSSDVVMVDDCNVTIAETSSPAMCSINQGSQELSRSQQMRSVEACHSSSTPVSACFAYHQSPSWPATSKLQPSTSELVQVATNSLNQSLQTLQNIEQGLFGFNENNNNSKPKVLNHVQACLNSAEQSSSCEPRLSYQEFVALHCADTDEHEYVQRLARYRQYMDRLEGFDVVSIHSSCSRETTPEVEITNIQMQPSCNPAEYIDMDTHFESEYTYTSYGNIQNSRACNLM